MTEEPPTIASLTRMISDYHTLTQGLMAGADSLRTELKAMTAHLNALTDTYANLYKLAGQLSKNASRYEWLRHGDNDDLVMQRGPVDKDFWYLPRNEKLDEMIDAQMAAEAGAVWKKVDLPQQSTIQYPNVAQSPADGAGNPL